MPDTLTDLWPEIETENIVTPLAILRFQAGQLRTKTKGLIEAEVRSFIHENGHVFHNLVIIAPALNRYEYVVATFGHDADLVYPVGVSIEGPTKGRSCSSQDELLDAVSELLRSQRVRAVITSLIAQSRDGTSWGGALHAKLPSGHDVST